MPNMVSTTSHSHSTSTQVPVLIVGAGPTGLFAALLLTKMGIPCRLIDRQHEPSKLSKALVIHARTLEIFQMVGRSDVKDEDTLLGKFMSEGSQLAEFYIYFGKKLTSIVPALRNTESRFNYGLFLEQAKTVEILTEELTKAGMHVERGWELMDTKVVEMDGASKSYVETTIRRAKVGTNIRANESKIMGAVELEEDQEGKEYDVEVVRSEYLIAADGGKSAVRHKLNISFKGRTLDNNMILYDGRVKADIPLDKITLIHGDCGRSIMVVPLSNGRVRIMLNNGTLTPEEHQAQKSEELTLSAFQEMVDTTVAPVKVELLDCDWLTYYRVNERLADRYSEKGRIFLSGDAAHVHSPAGGQGMNMGLQDTFNLTWKMALVLKGSASASILDTYEAERLKVAEDIIQLSSNIFGNGMADDFFHRMFKKFVLMALPYILPRVPHGPPMCMLRIRYHDNALNKTHSTQPAPKDEYQVGARARDGNLIIVDHDLDFATGTVQQPLRLHDLLVGPGIFHVLVFTSDMLIDTRGTNLKDIHTAAQDLAKETETRLATWSARWLTPSSPSSSSPMPKANYQEKMFMVHIISGVPVDSNKVNVLVKRSVGEGKLYLDVDGTVHQKYGVRAKGGPGSIVVLRPDSYVGYRVQGAGEDAWKDVDAYFNSILINVVEP